MPDKNQTATEARKAYYREWRAKNRDKVRRHNEAYWIRKGEQLKIERAGEKQ